MYDRILIFIATFSASLVFFYSCAMENPNFKVLSREWAFSLHDKQKNNVSEYKEYFKTIRPIIKKQEPLIQLTIYAKMIKQGIKLSNRKLVEKLCSYFMQVYNGHFQAFNNESEGFKIVQSVRKLLEGKTIYKKALSTIRLASCTHAIPPLLLSEPDQILKPTPRISSTDFFYNSDVELKITTLKNNPVLFDNTRPLAAWYFAEDALIGMTDAGHILSFNYKTGEYDGLGKKKFTKKTKPLLLIDKAIRSKNKDIHREEIKAGLYALLTKNKQCRQCLVTDDHVITSYDDGRVLFGAKQGTKRKDKLHTAKITALLLWNGCKIISGSKNGEIRLWNSKKKCCKVFTTMRNNTINSLVRFNDTLFSLDGKSYIELWDSKREKSNLIYYSEEPLKALQGFSDFLIAGLENGSLRIWHKKYGYNQSAGVRITPPNRLQALAVHDNTLFAFYKKGMMISFTYKYINDIFEKTLAKTRRGNNDFVFFNV